MNIQVRTAIRILEGWLSGKDYARDSEFAKRRIRRALELLKETEQ